jgi:predicted nucleic acid-binding protein
VALILVDTSVWVDHIRRPLPALAVLIGERRCVLHPHVLGEIALGNLPDWRRRIAQLKALPSIKPIPDDELLDMIDRLGLQGSGLGFTDAHLLATVVNEADMRLWSLDKRLAARADALDVGWSED